MLSESEQIEELIEFHVLFHAKGGHVQECFMTATCLLECEAQLQESHPEAVYWEIGI